METELNMIKRKEDPQIIDYIGDSAARLQEGYMTTHQGPRHCLDERSDSSKEFLNCPSQNYSDLYLVLS